MPKHISQQTDVLSDVVYPEPPKSGVWITDHAWVSGVAGLIAVLLLAACYSFADALGKGVVLAGIAITKTRIDSILLALIIIAAVMLAVEMIRLWRRDRENFFRIDPDLKKGRYGTFLRNGLVNWMACLCLLGAAILFFKTASEYGYANHHEYYQVWFRFLELAWAIYLWGGLPYVLMTRAVKHDSVLDRRDFSALAIRIFFRIVSYVPGLKKFRPEFNEIDKKAARGLLVKLFFTPLMTVFFAVQFPTLVTGIGQITKRIPDLIAQGIYTHNLFNSDLFTIGIACIATIDCALAWCGYTVSSRWVDNSTVSAEPTVLGWLVCLVCYPPFQGLLGFYYHVPSEQGILEFSQQWLVTIFTLMMIASYLVYMLATLCFGVRFSNLTNRGIIRKGPYAIVRHPAYASKNFAWWCVMFPVVVYNAVNTGLAAAAIQVVGLVFLTWLYYLRAMTEERHLNADPYYREYCKKVKYRFIPGMI